MSDNIKYYYLKLKENFFDSEEMKILEAQKNGVQYQNFYLKLCLLSLKSEGRLIFKEYLPYDDTMLSTVLRVDIDTVKTGMEIFIKMGLVEVMDTGLIFMTDIQSLIGTGSSEGDRKKEYRERIEQYKKFNNGQMSGQTSDIRTPEIERELKLKKEIIKNKDKGAMPPSLEDVSDYIMSISCGIDAQWFIDYYSARGWMIGKNKMKDWKAAVRTCERNRIKWDGEKLKSKPVKPSTQDSLKRYEEMEKTL